MIEAEVFALSRFQNIFIVNAYDSLSLTESGTMYYIHLPFDACTQIPCWDSFKIDPRLWRGVVFGRSFRECFWFGLRETRWARTAYAGNMGREYMMPVQGVGTHAYKSEIEALCWMTYILGCIFSCGIGQVFSICGNAGANCAACYTCHTRARMRNTYGLPPVFGLPLGIDDCLVHLLCFYCASHQ